MNNEGPPKEEQVDSIYVDADEGDRRIQDPTIAEEVAYAEKNLGRDAALALEHRFEKEARGEKILTEEQGDYLELINTITSTSEINGFPNPYYGEGSVDKVIDGDGYPALVIPHTYARVSCYVDRVYVLTKEGVFDCNFINNIDGLNHPSVAHLPSVDTNKLVKFILSSDIREKTDEGDVYTNSLPLNFDLLKIGKNDFLGESDPVDKLEVMKIDYEFFRGSSMRQFIINYGRSLEYEERRNLREKDRKRSLSDEFLLKEKE